MPRGASSFPEGFATKRDIVRLSTMQALSATRASHESS
jgi:hypothetical protein